jgi:hypothetical protein
MHKLKYVVPYIMLVFILTVLLQCKNYNDANTMKLQENNIETQKISSKDIESIKYTEYVLSDLAQEKTKDWITFQNLLDQIELLKKGDVSFFKDDKTILKSFIDDLKNEIPESLNTTSIIVRLTVLETTLFKLNELLNLQNVTKQSILNNIKDVLIAYNNVILQINKKMEKESQNIVKP